MGRQFAGILGCLAFCVAVVRHCLHGGDAVHSLPVALVGLPLFAVLGFIIGTMGEKIVDHAARNMVLGTRGEPGAEGPSTKAA